MTDKANSMISIEALKQITQYLKLDEGEYIHTLEKYCSQMREELEEKDEKIKNLKRIILDKTIENDEFKGKLLEKDKEIEELRKQNMVSPRVDAKYDFKVDVVDFSTDELCHINLLFVELINLANSKDVNDNYLILRQIDVAAVYLILAKPDGLKGTKYHYVGTLERFCTYWNINVVPYIEDKEHADSVTVKYDSVKTCVNRAPFKNLNPREWFVENRKKSKNETLGRALNIKAKLENSLIGR